MFVNTLWRIGAPSLLHPLVVNLIWMGDSARLNHSRFDKRKGQNMASRTPCPKCAGHVPGRGAWEFPSCLIVGLQHCIYARLVNCSATNNCKAASGGGGLRKMRGRVSCVCKSTGRPKCPLCQLFQAIDRAIEHNIGIQSHVSLRCLLHIPHICAILLPYMHEEICGLKFENYVWCRRSAFLWGKIFCMKILC